MMLLHDRIANGGDTLEKILCERLVGAFEGLDKGDAVIGLLAPRIDAFDA
jgi:hypothetical protein